MLGTVGVAPAGGEVRSSLVPDRFGGNMDTPQMRAGATVFLGVNVEGALFSIGDGHYRQGEGEACGTAVEGAMTTTLIVELVKGGAPAWPRIEDDTHWMTVGSSRPMEDSWRIGQRRARALGRRALRPAPDGRLPAGARRSRRCRSPTWSTPTTASWSRRRKSLLPAADAFGGIHADLRARARPCSDPRPTGGTGHGPPARPASASSSPAAPAASAGPSSRPSSTRAPSSASAPATPTRSTATEEALAERGRRQPAGRSTSATATRSRPGWSSRREAFGGLDVVVANVSALAIPDTEENWLASLNVDLMHTVRLVRAAMPHLERSDAASIIAISSVSGRESDFASGPVRHRQDGDRRLHPRPRPAAGRAGHPRQHGLARATPTSRAASGPSIEKGNPELYATAVALNPTGHMGTPEEVAAPVVFLASPVPAA